jgi:hypothetical protein
MEAKKVKLVNLSKTAPYKTLLNFMKIGLQARKTNTFIAQE